MTAHNRIPSTLRDNFREVYSAATESTQKLNLVASPFSYRVYHASKGWGRFWTWFYKVAGKWLREGKETLLTRALTRTQKVFNRHLGVIEQDAKRYDQYLSSCCKGDEKVKEERFFAARDNINDWNKATLPLLKQLLSEKNPKVQKIFGKSVQTGTLERLTCLQEVIDLEGVVGEKIPIRLLYLLANGRNLTKSQEKEVEDWIGKLNEASLDYSFPVGTFHRALYSVLETQFSDKNTAFVKLTHLEKALLKRRCSLFSRADPDYLRWRDQLGEGVTIYCNGKPIVLGPQVGKKREKGEVDSYKIFSLREAKQVIRAGNNCAVVPLANSFRGDAWGIEPATLEDVDKRQGFALMERFTLSLNVPITAFNRERQRGAVLLLQWFIEQNTTPFQFDPKYVFYDSEGRLRATKIFLRENIFNYREFEKFVCTSCGEDENLFKKLMEDSGVYIHENTKHHTEFYRAVVGNAVHGVPKEVNVLAADREISVQDAPIIRLGEALQEEILAFKNTATEELRSKFRMEDDEFDQHLSNQIVQAFKDSGSVSRLTPYVKKHILSLTGS